MMIEDIRCLIKLLWIHDVNLMIMIKARQGLTRIPIVIIILQTNDILVAVVVLVVV